ncbi:TolC family protein [Sphingobium sp. AN641]|uniref:TolC family protein n=1 Tax=Sphingobium sp. AN641 TaxID=3133443 RepID=UPI0030C33058
MNAVPHAVIAALSALVFAPGLQAQELADSTDPMRGYPAPVLPFDASDTEPAPTDSLAQAISDAYESNPLLAARRYELRATDNSLGLALSQTRTNIQAQLSGGYDYTDPGRITQASRPLIDRLNDPNIERDDIGGQIIIDQPLSTGGRARADIAAAGAEIKAGREALRGTEGDLLNELIAAYADVRRDDKALRIRQKNEQVLVRTLDEVAARRDAGELTRTDIAQAQTQLQNARVQLNVAQAQLQQSRAEFAALVGREPGLLAPEPPLPLVPASIDDAFDVADQMNPELREAVHVERASRARIASARAEGRPSLSLRGVAGTTGPASPLNDKDQDLSLSARATLTIPLAQGGRVGALVGQALDRNSADRLRIEAARRQMVRAIISAWNQMVTSKRNQQAQEAQLQAARIYYEGTFEEYRAGLRSTFDVLFAQNSLRDTEIALLASARDHYVSQAALLRQLGQLEVGKLITGNALYDPAIHSREVERRGALPWDAAVRALDGLGAASDRQQVIDQPARWPASPKMAPASPAAPDPQLMTHSPATPIIGTGGRPVGDQRP